LGSSFSKTSVFATSKMQVIGVALSRLQGTGCGEVLADNAVLVSADDRLKEKHGKGDFPQPDF